MGSWNCIEASPDWYPSQGFPVLDGKVAGIIIFSKKYQEKEALEICKSIREQRELDNIPLLVAITMYQMPLGNSVKKLPDANFIFVPLEKDALKKRLTQIKSR
jgi:hypothetical protein